MTLLSACLIVRDEEVNLPRCLAALDGVVDEVVVHDTGSTDRTRDIAAGAGATVIVGTWTDDFAAARNTALGACTGEWILHVDADEVLEHDPAELRAWLNGQPAAVDGALVEIENLMDDGTGTSYSHQACRLFRRRRGHWQGRIHEQVVGLQNLTADEPPARIVHHGYLRAAMAAKHKVDRNLALVHAALNDPATSADQRPALLLDLGRSLKAAGELDDAADVLARAATTEIDSIARAAIQFRISCLLGLGHLDDARDAIDALRRRSRNPAMADFLEGQLLLQEDRPGKALERFDAIDDLVDDEGRRPGPGVLPVNRATALSLLGRWDEAADELAAAVTVHKAVRGNVEALTDAFLNAGRSLDDLVKAVAPVAGEDIHAAALLVAVDDERGIDAVRAAAATVAARDLATVLHDLNDLAPACLPAFVEAAASTPERANAIAAALEEVGATEAAEALRNFSENLSSTSRLNRSTSRQAARATDRHHGLEPSTRSQGGNHGSPHQPKR